MTSADSDITIHLIIMIIVATQRIGIFNDIKIINQLAVRPVMCEIDINEISSAQCTIAAAKSITLIIMQTCMQNMMQNNQIIYA